MLEGGEKVKGKWGENVEWSERSSVCYAVHNFADQNDAVYLCTVKLHHSTMFQIQHQAADAG
jgi:hypothetical protein